MPKINRYVGNLEAFGIYADPPDREVFGGLSGSRSDNITDNITESYLTGWGIIGPNDFPPIEYFNAAQFTATQITAYVHQAGVPEWDLLQVYYIGSICNSAGHLYRSLTDNNVGNAVTNNTYWYKITQDNAQASFLEFGAVGNGFTDCTPALNAFLSSSYHALFIPAGNYFFNSRPDSIERAVRIFGDNKRVSVLTKNYIEAGSDFEGFLTVGPEGGETTIEDISLVAYSGTSKGAAIYMYSDASHRPTGCTLNNIIVRGNGTFSHGVYINGRLNANSISQLAINNVEILSVTAVTKYGLYLENITRGRIKGFFKGASRDVLVNGTLTTDNSYTTFDLFDVDKMEIKASEFLNVRAARISEIITDATTVYALVFGQVIALSGGWVDSHIYGSYPTPP